MTTYTSFKPSVQFLEAGEKAQEFGNAANTFKPFLPQEARQSIEGIDKVSQAFTATGRALEHFGFDEAEEDEIIGGDVAKEGKNVLQKVAIKGISQKIQGPVRLVLGAEGAIEGYADPSKIEENSQAKIREADQRGEGGKVRTYHALSPVSTAEEDLKNVAQRIHNDPKSTELQKVTSKIGHGIVYTVNRTVLAPVTFVESIGRFFVSIFDEDESEGLESGGQENQTRAAIRDRVFGSNPETLAPIDFNSSVVTDAYQQQEGPGADLIGGPTNQRTDSYQAQENQYAVLA